MLFCKYIFKSASNPIVFNVGIVMFLEFTKTYIANNLKLPQPSPLLWLVFPMW